MQGMTDQSEEKKKEVSETGVPRTTGYYINY